jgi:hypothetical protein
VAGVFASAAVVVANGCTTDPAVFTIYCKPDADPDADINGDCYPDGGHIEPLSCESAGGECVAMGTSDFRERAVLLWMGDEEENAPKCPERAESLFYTGYSDLHVSFQCAECACGPAGCAFPSEMEVDSQSFCQGANKIAYAAAPGWNGACASPSMLPPGSFHSIKPTPAGVMPCEPIGDLIPDPPKFAPSAPRPASFVNGISWGSFAKACQGTADGKCDSSGDLCLPSAEPPPPGFRQCVQYDLPVDDSKLPTCPDVFPDRFVFYASTEGSIECLPCQCGEPIGAQCAVSFSAYQDAACAGVPMPLFENVPAFPGVCIDFGAASLSLGSMEAKWISNEPGACEPSGGELIGDVKAADPRVFCCQAPPAPQAE